MNTIKTKAFMSMAWGDVKLRGDGTEVAKNLIGTPVTDEKGNIIGTVVDAYYEPSKNGIEYVFDNSTENTGE